MASRITVLVIAIAWSVTAAGGGDRSVGVSRTARLSELPEFDCIGEVIRTSPEVEKYEAKKYEASGVYGPSYKVYYEGGGLEIDLGVFEDAPGKVRFVQSFLWGADRRLTKQEVDGARKLMSVVEVRLENACSIERLSAQIRETCFGVECD